jgi:hypothetical protein
METFAIARLLTPEAVAEIIGRSVATLATQRTRGGGPPFRKLGGRVVYPADSLEQWIAGHPLQDSTSDQPRSDRSARARRKANTDAEPQRAA